MIGDYFKRYFTHLLTISHFPADKILCWLLMIAGASNHFWDEKVPDDVSDIVNTLVLCLAVLAFLWTFFSAPYFVWKEVKLDNDALKSEIEAKKTSHNAQAYIDVRTVRDYLSAFSPSTATSYQDWWATATFLLPFKNKMPSGPDRDSFIEVYDLINSCLFFHIGKALDGFIEVKDRKTEDYIANIKDIPSKIDMFIEQTDWNLGK